MPETSYADFDLWIERRDDGRYWTRASCVLTKDATAEFRPPLKAAEISGLLSRLFRPRRARNLKRPTAKAPDLRRLGHQLFRALIHSKVEDCLRRSLDKAAAQNLGLRLRLRLDGVPDLARLPWEYLCDPEGDFLALAANTPIVRFPEVAQEKRSLVAALPLRMLVLIASPVNLSKLDGEAEMRHIETALGDRVKNGQVILDRVVPATFTELLRRLQKDRWHVLHFIGHGGFDRQKEEGVLMFEDGERLANAVGGRDLGRVLNRRKISLVVLNACEGARHSESDALAGVAQTLIHREIPAVVAMQSEVSDGAAVIFAQHFYQHLAENFPVDGALAEARLAMLTEGYATEWGTPVLYMGSSDGCLFAAQGESLPHRWQRWRPMVTRVRSPWTWGLAALLIAGVYLLLDSPASRPATVEQPRPVPKQTLSFKAEPIRVAPAPSFPELPASRTLTTKPSSPVIPAFALPSPPAGCPSPPGTDIRFVRIKPGKFRMGSTRKGEKPAHWVTITEPFCLSATEVTNRQWLQVMGGQPHPTPHPEDSLPVKATWDEAHQFAARLNAATGQERYRLPTEAQWEYVARAGSKSDYSFGKNPSDLYKYGNCLNGSGPNDGFDGLAPVASFKPNDWGLYDMQGNVWEWVADWYSEEYPSDLEVVDPLGPATGKQKVRRGGGREASAFNCRVSARKGSAVNFTRGPVGFRLLRVVDRQP